MKQKDYKEYMKHFEGMSGDEQIRVHIHELKQNAEKLDMDTKYETIESTFQLMDQLYQIEDQIVFISECVDNKTDKKRRNSYKRNYMKKNDYKEYMQRFEGMSDDERIRAHIHELKQKAERLDMDTRYETIESTFQLMDQLYQIEDQIVFISECVDNKTDKKRRNCKLEWVIFGILTIVIFVLKIAFFN